MLGMRIGIDLGTDSIIAYAEGKGIVLSEPSVVVCDAFTGKPVAMGGAALKMTGRVPGSLNVVRPLKDGIVSDFKLTELMLRYYIQKICKSAVLRPFVAVCVPSTVTRFEKKTILNVIMAAGAGNACLIEEPLAAALGAGIGTKKPRGSVVVDIGGGTTDTAVITMGSIAVSSSVKAAGGSITNAIIRYLSRERDIEVGYLTAEEIKCTIGSAVLREEETAMVANGKSIVSGMPLSFEINSTEVYYAIKDELDHILQGTLQVLERTPPELMSDIMDTGLTLTGGGSLLYGMAEMFKRHTGIDTDIAGEPQYCVARGIGAALRNADILRTSSFALSQDELLAASNI